MKDIEAAFVARVGSELELKTSAAGKPWTSVNVGDGDEVQWLRLVVMWALGHRETPCPSYPTISMNSLRKAWPRD